MTTSNGSSSGADFAFDNATFQPGLGHGTDVAAAPAPSQPSAFAAGLSELVADPLSFFKDLVPGVQGGYVPKEAPTVSGAASQFVDDFTSAPGKLLDAAKNSLPDYGKTLVLAGVAVVGLVAVAYVAHKTL
jgi:hypothetical protein